MSRFAARPAVLKEKLLDRVMRFTRSAWNELKKVHWPSRREIAVYTGVVLVSVFVVALVIFVVDSIFATVFNKILAR